MIVSLYFVSWNWSTFPTDGPSSCPSMCYHYIFYNMFISAGWKHSGSRRICLSVSMKNFFKFHVWLLYVCCAPVPGMGWKYFSTRFNSCAFPVHLQHSIETIVSLQIMFNIYLHFIQFLIPIRLVRLQEAANENLYVACDLSNLCQNENESTWAGRWELFLHLFQNLS